MNEETIKSFLVSIGYKTDETSLKKFQTSLEAVGKKVLAVGAAVAATATAVVAGVKVISGEMERLYYASQRTHETVGNIMALRYAAAQVGLTADQAQGALEGFARTLRLNPGSDGLLASLGVTGNGPLEQFESFIGKMRQMQPYIAAQYARQFGIDPDTLLTLEQGQDERLAKADEYRKKLARIGLNPARAAEAGKNFDNSLRNLLTDINIFAILLEEHLAPVLTKIADEFGRWADKNSDEVARKIADALEAVAKWVAEIDWNRAGKDVDTFISKAKDLAEVIGNIVGGVSRMAKWFGVDLGGGASASSPDQSAAGTPESSLPPGTPHPSDSPFLAWVRSHVQGLRDGYYGKDGDPSKRVDAASLFAGLEKAVGLPAGSLDQLWDMESSRGKNMLSPAGAKGHFQFMDATAEQYGVKDPNDLVQSATGAAHYLHDLLNKYRGDLMKALAAYNWGGGNLDKDIAAHGDAWMNFLPKETANYLGKFDGAKLGAGGAATKAGGSVTVSQQNTFNVQGSPDPNGTARAVSGEQRRIAADMVRNLSTRFG